MTKGEGLINGRRHALENIAGREGRKSSETAKKTKTEAKPASRKSRSNELEKCQSIPTQNNNQL